jgi:hypothetical protein
LNRGIVLFFMTRRGDRVHQRKPSIERGKAKHAAGGSLVVAEDHEPNARFYPDRQAQPLASKPEKLSHVEFDVVCVLPIKQKMMVISN